MVDEFLDKVKFAAIGFSIIPYVVIPEEFHEMVELERRLQSENLAKALARSSVSPDAMA